MAASLDSHGNWRVSMTTTRKRRANESGNDFRGAIRVLPVRIVKPDEEQDRRWYAMSQLMQRMQNRVVYYLREFHVEKGNGEKVWRWMNDLKAWHAMDPKTRPKKKPALDVICWPKEFSDGLSTKLSRDFPGIHSRPLTLAIQKLRGDIQKRKANNSAFKQWQLIVTDQGQERNWSRPQPIPVDRQNCELLPPEGEEEPWRCKLRIDREAVTGKNGKPRSQSTLDVVELAHNGRKAYVVLRVLRGCTDGTLKFCGSNLKLKDGKWFLMVTYRERKLRPADVDHKRQAVLQAEAAHPWSLEVDERKLKVGGDGRLLLWHRRLLAACNESRRQAMRNGSKKGHGRNKKYIVFSNRLAGFKKTYTEQVAARVVQIAVERRIGTIVFEKPAGDTFLTTAGAGPNGDRWPWERMEVKLRQHAERLNLMVTVRTAVKDKEVEVEKEGGTQNTERGGAVSGRQVMSCDAKGGRG